MPDVSLSEFSNDELLFNDDHDFDSPHSSADEEYESDEPPAVKFDLQKLKDCASKVASARCVNARMFARGSYHEIFLLDFEPSPDTIAEIATARNSCIARLTRCDEPVARATSELATMKYVKDHSSIPVAKVFYQDLCPDNEVGAPFILMERLPGKHLYKLWRDLSLEHKKDVLAQIAHVLITFSTFHFDRIGSLQDYGVGPLVHHSLPEEDKPFSSTEEYLSAFFQEDTVENPELKDVFRQVRQELKNYFSKNSDLTYLNAPFRLIYGGIDAQSFLFTESSSDSAKAPTLSGVLDFEYSYTGPVYYLYEYPIFIQDVDTAPELYEENAILRPHFLRVLRNAFPRDSLEAKEVRNAMGEKCSFLNGVPWLIFSLSLTTKDGLESTEYIISAIRGILERLREGTALAYDGRTDYVPDPEPDSDED